MGVMTVSGGVVGGSLGGTHRAGVVGGALGGDSRIWVSALAGSTTACVKVGATVVGAEDLARNPSKTQN